MGGRFRWARRGQWSETLACVRGRQRGAEAAVAGRSRLLVVVVWRLRVALHVWQRAGEPSHGAFSSSAIPRSGTGVAWRDLGGRCVPACNRISTHRAVPVDPDYRCRAAGARIGHGLESGSSVLVWRPTGEVGLV